MKLFYKESTHTYTLDDKKVPAVTSIIGKVLAKPAIAIWMLNEAIGSMKGTLKKIQSGEYKIITDEFIDTWCKEAGTAHRKKSGDALDTGSLIHKRIEEIIKGERKQEGCEEVIQKHINNFFDWYKKEGISDFKAEKKLASMKYQFAGTCDGVGTVNGKRVLFDWKTSSGIYPEYKLQVSAYSKAWEECYKEKIDECKIVRIDKKTSEIEVTEVKDIDKQFEIFTNILNIYNFFNKK